MKKLLNAQFGLLMQSFRLTFILLAISTFTNNVDAQATLVSDSVVEDVVGETLCPDPNTVGCTPELTLRSTIVLPEYPDCSFDVKYKYRVCQGVTEIYGIEYLFNGVLCEKLLKDFFAIFTFTGDAQEAIDNFSRTIIIGSYEEILTQLFKKYATANPNAATCGNVTKAFSTAYYPGGCTTVVQGVDKKTGELVVKTISCGTTCCKVSSQYCREKNGTIKKFNEEVTEIQKAACITNPAADLPEDTTEIDWELKSICLTVCK